MCGIAGSLGIESNNHAIAVEKMLQSIRHRGPDGKGIVTIGENRSECIKSQDSSLNIQELLPAINARAAFGQVRLAILDLSEAGLQPMCSANGKSWIVFNGEVYNFIELRQELSKLGHTFQTKTDTEVVLAAFGEWDQKMLDRLDGMFAFAIFDIQRKHLFCARDRFGEKPFYYTLTNDTFNFASEIKALLSVNPKQRPNLRSVANFLSNGQTYFNDQTFYEEIFQLPAGNYLELDWNHPNQPKIQAYYCLPNKPNSVPLSLSKYGEEFYCLLEKSVQLRLRADVPVGTCLSGGLDSSSIATLCLKQLGFNTPTFNAFTAVPDEPYFSELDWARLVVNEKCAKLNEVNVSRYEVSQDIDELVHVQDEPFPTLSMYLQFRVMKAARSFGIPVLMDGQGGDETLMGYERMYGTYLAEMMLKGHLFKVPSEFQAYVRNSQVGTLSLLALMAYSRKEINNFWRSVHQDRWLVQDLRQLISKDTCPETLFERQRYELNYLPLPSLLRYEDRNAMNFSIETRLPFLDHKLVEFCLQAPPEAKLHDGWTKWMLRAGMQNLLPPQITWRKDKKGFAAPDQVWMKILHEEAYSNLYQHPMSAQFYKSQNPWKIYQANLKSNHHFAWRIFCIEKWMRTKSVDLS